MDKTLKKIIEKRLKNANANAKRIGLNTEVGKMFLGKAELLESILEENKEALTLGGVVKSLPCMERKNLGKNLIKKATHVLKIKDNIIKPKPKK